jgi:hypothetical protein
LTILDKSSRKLQTLRGAESTARLVATLICGGFTALFLGRFFQCFEKLLTEFAVALSYETQDFTAQVWAASEYDWRTFGFHSLHLFGLFLCSFSVHCLCRFPGATKKLSGPFRISVPQHVPGSCLHARAPRLIFKAAGLVREATDEGNGDSPLLRGFGVRFFGCGLRFFRLRKGDRGAQSKAETRNCGEG